MRISDARRGNDLPEMVVALPLWRYGQRDHSVRILDIEQPNGTIRCKEKTRRSRDVYHGPPHLIHVFADNLVVEGFDD
jgi:hypothetical protein